MHDELFTIRSDNGIVKFLAPLIVPIFMEIVVDQCIKNRLINTACLDVFLGSCSNANVCISSCLTWLNGKTFQLQQSKNKDVLYGPLVLRYEALALTAPYLTHDKF